MMNRRIRWVLFGCGLMVMLACSPPSYLYDVGITQFCRDGAEIVAYQHFVSYFSQTIDKPLYSQTQAVTRDEGLTWKMQTLGGGCGHPVAIYPFAPGIQRFNWQEMTFEVVPHDGIYRTTADAVTIKEFDLSRLYHEARFLYFTEQRDQTPDSLTNIRKFYRPVVWDVIGDPLTGNLLLAMGLDGVLMRSLDGTWSWSAVGQYQFLPAVPSLFYEVIFMFGLIPLYVSIFAWSR